MRTRVSEIWYEMARRKVAFHKNEDWRGIRLWGLFLWGDVRRLIERGELLTDMQKENRTIWVRPSEGAYKKHIEPLLKKYSLEELSSLAGW